MLYQLENGSLLNIESLEDIEDLLTSDQLGAVAAVIATYESTIGDLEGTIEDLEGTIEDLESTIDATNIQVKGLKRYVERYGFKNERKVKDKINNILF